jgi:hypothetical protein
MNFERGAIEYCKLRLTIGAVLGAVVAVLCCVAAIVVPFVMGDSSRFVAIDGKVVSSAMQVRRKGGKSYVIKIEYVVNGKTYSMTTSDRVDAGLGSARRVYYDPLNPTATVDSINAENKIGWLLAAGALLSAGGAAFSYVMRENPVMCGLTVASDAVSLFRS